MDRYLRVTHPSATDTRKCPCDLHVLSMPPAFALSQEPQDIHGWVRVEREIAPQAHNRVIYDALYAEYLRLYQGSKHVMHRLKAINAGHP